MATATGVAVAVAGVGFMGMGLLARRDVSRALEQEYVTGVPGRPPDAPLADPTGARAMAEFIRRNTIAATGGRTYAQVEPYVDAEAKPTADSAQAARDERTGQPLENPDHELWIQSTTLQTALMQAYMGFRVAELTFALGASFVAVGAALVAAGRRRQ